MNYYTYIVRCSDDTLYTGWTTDLERRILEHNTSDKGAKYTHGRRPIVLVHSEIHTTESEARKREYSLKQLPKKKKLQLIKTPSS